MNYFAYGSNLSTQQMGQRCPGAKRRTSARLPNYKLVFTGRSRSTDGGTATIQLQKGEHVLGGLYEIDEKCLRALDRLEGYPTVYERMNVIVFSDLGDAIEAVTYYKKDRAPEEAPSRQYLAAIRAGYEDWGLL